jgi:hypothetical protein
MLCESVKNGRECFFMHKNGCQFNGGTCHPVVEQCDGCRNVTEFSTGTFCNIAPDPAIKWRLGNCNMATHVQTAKGKRNGRVNPLKASKRSAQ